jgi:2-polyprenyl-3-methyl-5-hydroxy-6-metoxy-1,4-benzoquinol methylase
MFVESRFNPHFDEDKVIWKDEYSGRYQSIVYDEEFDRQWELFLKGKPGFTKHTGVETDDDWIDDRIYDLTGVHGTLGGDKSRSNRDVGGRQNLTLRFSPDYFYKKKCIDIACGAGRWTKTLMSLGAQVKSIDVSKHGLESVRRFNSDVEKVNLFEIVNRIDLHNAFDFALAWGVVMSTHDPKIAFKNAALTVKPGGGLYIMAYAPTYHNSPVVLSQRRHYHRDLSTFSEKMEYLYQVAESEDNLINYHDMLNPFYNWVIEESTIHRWYHENGFSNVVTLNVSEVAPVAYHVFGVKRGYNAPLYDDVGRRVPQPIEFDDTKIMDLREPFCHDAGNAWLAMMPELNGIADCAENLSRSRLVLLENGQPMWFSHSLHKDIREVGMGLYSHWGDYLLFSTSDNSDPNLNGKKYQFVLGD